MKEIIRHKKPRAHDLRILIDRASDLMSQIVVAQIDEQYAKRKCTARDTASNVPTGSKNH